MPSIPPDRLDAWRLFLQAHRRVTDALERDLRREHDLPLAWYDVLVHLSEAEGKQLRMQELAGRVLLSKSGLSRLVDRLEKHGYVDRHPCEDDGRVTFAVLTDEGLEQLQRAHPIHAAGVAALFTDQLDDDETAALRSALARIVKISEGLDHEATAST